MWIIDWIRRAIFVVLSVMMTGLSGGYMALQIIMGEAPRTGPASRDAGVAVQVMGMAGSAAVDDSLEHLVFGRLDFPIHDAVALRDSGNESIEMGGQIDAASNP